MTLNFVCQHPSSVVLNPMIMVLHAGATLPVTSKPSSNGKATTHMRLLPGEDEVFRVSELGGCAWARNEVSMVPVQTACSTSLQLVNGVHSR